MKNRNKIRFSWVGIPLTFLLFFCVTCDDLLDNLDTGDPRNRLVDAWKCDEDSTYYKSGLEIYWVNISKHPTDSVRILISNFYNVDTDAEAILSGRKLTLPLQTLQSGYTVSGSGDVQADWDEIIWSYSVNDGSGMTNNARAIYTRLK